MSFVHHGYGFLGIGPKSIYDLYICVHTNRTCVTKMNGYKHTIGTEFTHLAAVLFLQKERPGQCYKKEKKRAVVFFPPQSA